MTPQRLIWHHSADAYEGKQLAKIDAYHKTRDFPISSLGFYVGYHWIIECDGSVVQTRKEDEIGAHDAGENFNSIGVCFARNMSIQQPTEAQAIAAAKLCGEILKRWHIPITRVEPHRWDDETECPGTLVEDRWFIKNYLQRESNALYRAFYWLGEYLGLL